ncbi:hypothetical protein QUC31_019829 [Theobroma cacao]
MKPGVSSLNPYAASYIPLAKREGNDNVAAKDIKRGNETAWYEPSSHLAHNPHHSNTSLDSVTHGTGKHQIPEACALKSHPAHGSFMQNLGEMTDKQIMDEEFDMDLEYLCMIFPGLSNESLLDVYWMYTVESSETLPDTLDIGDVSESGSSATCGALKLKNVAGEASASSSGSAEPAVAS